MKSKAIILESEETSSVISIGVNEPEQPLWLYVGVSVAITIIVMMMLMIYRKRERISRKTL